MGACCNYVFGQNWSVGDVLRKRQLTFSGQNMSKRCNSVVKIRIHCVALVMTSEWRCVRDCRDKQWWGTAGARFRLVACIINYFWKRRDRGPVLRGAIVWHAVVIRPSLTLDAIHTPCLLGLAFLVTACGFLHCRSCRRSPPRFLELAECRKSWGDLFFFCTICCLALSNIELCSFHVLRIFFQYQSSVWLSRVTPPKKKLTIGIEMGVNSSFFIETIDP